MNYSLRTIIVGAAAAICVALSVGSANAHDRGHRDCDHRGYGHSGHQRHGHRSHYNSHYSAPMSQYGGYYVPGPRAHYQPSPVVGYSQAYTNQPYYPSRSYQQSPNFSNAVGGALGGFVGSKIGKGSGQLATTAAGAVAGYLIGGHIGNGYR